MSSKFSVLRIFMTQIRHNIPYAHTRSYSYLYTVIYYCTYFSSTILTISLKDILREAAFFTTFL